ncbi:APC family permease [Specibacter cremeus]|uniref:APC family permease n=1 Tax=Specibacter cremeus TaxID=1629051 RepID=UPI000F7B2EE0|nr:APC family permease [Specibacter cremeus]
MTRRETSTVTSPDVGATRQNLLHRNSIGVPGIVFFVVAAAAPIAGMTGLVPSAIVMGNGAGAPGAFLIAGIMLLFFAVGYAAMSHHVTNAGAFFAFVGRGLGAPWGVASAFVSVLSYCLVQTAIYGFLGATVASKMASLGVDLPWWVWCLICIAVVQVFGILNVDLGAKVLGVLLVVELSSMIVTGLAVVFHGGGPDGMDFGASFGLGNIFQGAPGIAFAFAFAGFIGFEATAIYGEECRDPKRTVPRATYTAVIIITLIFALTSFAIISGAGSKDIVNTTIKLTTLAGTPLADPAQLLFTVAGQYVGPWMPELMSWLLITSMFAGVLAFHNSATRYFYAMGRSGLLPAALGTTGRFNTPARASVLQTAIGTITIVVFAITGLDPVVTLFYWFAITAILGLTFIQGLVCLSVIRFFRRTRADTRIWNTLIAPLLGLVSIIVAEYLLLARFGLISGTAGADGRAWEMNATGWCLAALPFVVFLAALAYGFMLERKKSDDEVLRDFVS